MALSDNFKKLSDRTEIIKKTKQETAKRPTTFSAVVDDEPTAKKGSKIKTKRVTKKVTKASKKVQAEPSKVYTPSFQNQRSVTKPIKLHQGQLDTLDQLIDLGAFTDVTDAIRGIIDAIPAGVFGVSVEDFANTIIDHRGHKVVRRKPRSN